MKLIDDIKQFHKFLSVQATVIGGFFIAWVVSDPAAASAALGGVIPKQYMPFVSIAISMIVSLGSRAIAQPKLNKGQDDANK